MTTRTPVAGYNTRLRNRAAASNIPVATNSSLNPTSSLFQPPPAYGDGETTTIIPATPVNLQDVATRLFSDVVASRPPSPLASAGGSPERGSNVVAFNDTRAETRLTNAPEALVPVDSSAQPTTNIIRDIRDAFENEARSEDGHWTTVRRRRQSRDASPESGPEINHDNTHLTQEQNTAVRDAERQLSDQERAMLARRYEVVNTAATSGAPPKPLSDDSSIAEVPKDKGKGIDIRNWGNLGLTQDETDVELQRAAFDMFNKGRSNVPFGAATQMNHHQSRNDAHHRRSHRSRSRKIKSKSHSAKPDEARESKEHIRTGYDFLRATSQIPASSYLGATLNALPDKLPGPSRPRRRRDPSPSSSDSSSSSSDGSFSDEHRHDGSGHSPPSDDGSSDDSRSRSSRPNSRIRRRRQRKQKSKSRKGKSSGRKVARHRSRRDYRSDDDFSSDFDSDSMRSEKDSKRMLIRPIEPRRYSGQRDLRAFTQFSQQTSAYLSQGRVPADQQVSITSNFLSGRAYDFFVRRVANNPQNWTLKQFFSELFDFVFPPDFRLRLRDDIARKRQESSSVVEYTYELEELFNVVGDFDEQAKVVKLWTGFRQSIQAALWLERLNPEISDWESVKKAAMVIEMAEQAASRANRIPHRGDFYRPNYRDHRATRRDYRDRHPRRYDSYVPRQDYHRRDSGPIRANSAEIRSRGRHLGRGGHPSRSTPNLRVRNTQDGRQRTEGARTHTRPPNPPSSRPGPPGGVYLPRDPRNPATRNNTSTAARPGPSAQAAADGRCFRCQETGHLARNCPKGNVVNSNSSKPPGVTSFSAEYEDHLHADEDGGVLDSLPLGSIAVAPPNSVPEVQIQVPVLVDSAKEGDEEDLTYPDDLPDLMEMDEGSEYDVVEWPNYDPDRRPRSSIGEPFEMVAATILTSSQPYPGDPDWVTRDNRIPERFSVHRAYIDDYLIEDRFSGIVSPISVCHLRNPDFAVADWYARRRGELYQLEVELEYSRTMGDALGYVAECLLRDGITHLYPSPETSEVEDEFRFDVQLFNSDFYCINDFARDKFVLIHYDELSNIHFDLTRWYQLVVRQERGFENREFCLPGIGLSTLGGTESPPLFESDPEDDFRATTPPSDFELSSGDDTPIGPSANLGHERLGDVFAETLQSALTRGVPYPGEGSLREMTRRERSAIQTRFAAYRVTGNSTTYEVFDSLTNEVVYLPEERLREPRFNVGLWYARRLCRSRGLDEGRGLARWFGGRVGGETSMGRCLENRIQELLKKGAPYSADAGVLENQHTYRFFVELNSSTVEALDYLVLDRRLEVVTYLPVSLTRDPRFDPAEWYRREMRDRTPNVGSMDVDSVSWQSNQNQGTNGDEIHLPVFSSAVAVDFAIHGVQVPRNTYNGVQRNASSVRDRRIVPKPIVVVVKINGQPARALLDSGSLGDFVSSTLADQLNLRREPLEVPLTLQLAVQGSRSKINSKVSVQFEYQDIDETRTFDVINISSYDLILGTPFLHQHQVCIGLHPARVVVGSATSLPVRPGPDSRVVVSGIAWDNDEIEHARTLLMKEAEVLCKDVDETPLPPLRAINHTIPLVDESKIYPWRPSRCPEVFRTQWAEKRDKYLRSGRWEITSSGNTVPMLLIPKPKREKPELRTVIDLRERNKNTMKLASPLPDIEGILRRLAKKPFRSSLDMKAAYEQIRVIPEHVHRTTMTTPDGNMVSHVIQQGDCNAPATYQALMNHIFSPYIGRFMDIYLDDIVIYSDTVEDHIEHIRTIFQVLKREQLYLGKDKLRLFARELDILGRIVDDEGIRMDPSKVDSVLAWKTPTNRDLLRGFLGSVGYLADDVPGVRIPMGVLSAITGDTVPFRWGYTEQRAFEDVKRLVHDAREHRRVPLDYSEGAPPIWLVTDGCATGVAGIVSQGDDWKTAKVAAFYSAKLNSAQQNYPTHEIEMLAGVESMLRNADILQGVRFRWVTDHKGLVHLLNQKNLSGRQARWLEKISTFDFKVEYIPGAENVLADSLSRMYSNDAPGTVRARTEYTFHDVTDDDSSPVPHQTAPILTGLEALAARVESRSRRKEKELPAESGRSETGREFAARMAPHFTIRGPREKGGEDAAGRSMPTAPVPKGNDVPRLTIKVPPLPKPKFGSAPADPGNVAPQPPMSLVQMVESTAGIDLIHELRDSYSQDPIFKPIVAKPSEFRNFVVENGIVYLKENSKRLLCIPKVLILGRNAREIVIDEAHSLLAHLGASKTIEYLRHHVWWKDLVSDTRAFCETCTTCRRSKPDNQKPYGLLNPLPVPTVPWESIGIDFVGPLPNSSNRNGTYDSITVVICLLTGMVHLIPSQTTMTAAELAELMFEEIYKHHGIPQNIVSDRDVLFMSTFWQRLHALLGSRLKMSSAYHPQTDGSTERANRTITQMLRQCVNEKQTDWVRRLPGIEFAINSARSESTGYSPFFLNYGRLPRAMIWNSATKDEFPAVRNFALQKKLALMQAHDSILATRVKQTRDANRRRRIAPFVIGDLVYISTKNISFPKGLARKLVPKYIGPYKILEDFKNFSFRIDLPASLKARGVHDVFHSSLLRVHKPNNDRLFPGRLDSQVAPIDDKPTESEWSIDHIVSHSGSGRNAMFEVKWRAGDRTWLPYDQVRDLEPLRAYLEALEVDDIVKLEMGTGKLPSNDPEIHVGSISFEFAKPTLGARPESLLYDSPTSDLSPLAPMYPFKPKHSKYPKFKRHTTPPGSPSSSSTPNPSNLRTPFFESPTTPSPTLDSIRHPSFVRKSEDIYNFIYTTSDNDKKIAQLHAGQLYFYCMLDGLIRRGTNPGVLPLGYKMVAATVDLLVAGQRFAWQFRGLNANLARIIHKSITTLLTSPLQL